MRNICLNLKTESWHLTLASQPKTPLLPVSGYKSPISQSFPQGMDQGVQGTAQMEASAIVLASMLD